MTSFNFNVLTNINRTNFYFNFKFGRLERVTVLLDQSEDDTKTSLSNQNITTVKEHTPNFLVALLARFSL